jgi:hypothetical protein
MTCWWGRHHWTKWERSWWNDTCDNHLVNIGGRLERASTILMKSYTRKCIKCGKFDFRNERTPHCPPP